MSTSPPLCDRAKLLRQRARAQRSGFESFLHEEAAIEFKERLSDVNREFKSPAIVTGFVDFWASQFPNATVVRDDDVLDLDVGAHDLVLHTMSLHWANDPVGQLVQCRRALVDDGLFLAAFFGGQTLTELRQAIGQAETTHLGGMSPRVAPMGEIRDVGALLQRAGLALPVADNVKRVVSYRSAYHLMRDLRAMGETNALSHRSGKPCTRAMLLEIEKVYSDAFQDKDGRVKATFEMIFLSGWAPDSSQQQPLKPGSATSRLADFLNTPELGEDAKPKAGE